MDNKEGFLARIACYVHSRDLHVLSAVTLPFVGMFAWLLAACVADDLCLDFAQREMLNAYCAAGFIACNVVCVVCYALHKYAQSLSDKTYLGLHA